MFFWLIMKNTISTQKNMQERGVALFWECISTHVNLSLIFYPNVRSNVIELPHSLLVSNPTNAHRPPGNVPKRNRCKNVNEIDLNL